MTVCRFLGREAYEARHTIGLRREGFFDIGPRMNLQRRIYDNGFLGAPGSPP